MDYFYAFLIGGAICGICQIFIDKTKLTPARILVTLVTLGVILTGLGIYQKLIDFAGCGASVPLLGFGYSLAIGVEKAVNEYGFIGILTGGLTASAAGVSSAILFGFIFALIFKPKTK